MGFPTNWIIFNSEGSHHQLIRIHYATLPDNYTDSVARTEVSIAHEL